MQIMSPEAYQHVWFLFPAGIIVYCIFIALLQFFFGKKIAYVSSLIICLGIFLFLLNIIGLGVRTYFIVGIYLFFGFFASFGRMRAGGKSSGSRRGTFGGGSSGGGGATGRF